MLQGRWQTPPTDNLMGHVYEPLIGRQIDESIG